MRSTIKTIGALLASMALSTVSTAAPIVGTPTDSGSTTQVGLYNGVSGVVKYFIPLTPNNHGTYGVSDGGTYGESADVDPAPLGGSVMDMYLHFDIAAGLKGTELTLWFDDLDLKTSNDPTGFFETIRFTNLIAGDINTATTYTAWSQLSSLSNVSLSNPNPSNNDDVSITISGLDVMGDFWLNLQFTSYSEGLRDGKYYRNTAEYLKGKLTTVDVSEPATLSLLGLGLLGLAYIRRKKV